jgi:hypothetical protein
MNRYIFASVVIIFLALTACQQPATSDIANAVAAKLSYSDVPTWSGSTWTGTSTLTIMKNIATASAITSTPLSLQSTTIIAQFNSNNTFTATATTTNDSSNYESNFIGDNYNYSTSQFNLSPPILAANYTNYTDSNENTVCFIDGNLLYAYSIGSSLYTTGTTQTTYNGQTVYPLTYKTLTAGSSNGKTNSIITFTGTWKTYLSTNNPTYTGPSIQILLGSKSTITYTYGASPTQVTQNYSYPANSTPSNFYYSKGVDSTGRSTFVLTTILDTSYGTSYTLYMQ